MKPPQGATDSFDDEDDLKGHTHGEMLWKGIAAYTRAGTAPATNSLNMFPLSS